MLTLMSVFACTYVAWHRFVGLADTTKCMIWIYGICHALTRRRPSARTCVNSSDHLLEKSQWASGCVVDMECSCFTLFGWSCKNCHHYGWAILIIQHTIPRRRPSPKPNRVLPLGALGTSVEGQLRVMSGINMSKRHKSLHSRLHLTLANKH